MMEGNFRKGKLKILSTSILHDMTTSDAKRLVGRVMIYNNEMCECGFCRMTDKRLAVQYWADNNPVLYSSLKLVKISLNNSTVKLRLSPTINLKFYLN